MTHGFTPNSEAYLAAVWYAMKDAQDQWSLDQKRIEEGRLNKWGYLRKVQQLFHAEPLRVPYSVMRTELQEFANSFGNPDAVNLRDMEAAEVFMPDPPAAVTHRRHR